MNQNIVKGVEVKKFVVPVDMRAGYALKGLCEVTREKARDQKTVTSSKKLYGCENEEVCNERAYK